MERIEKEGTSNFLENRKYHSIRRHPLIILCPTTHTEYTQWLMP
jgi:hypothetical protein